MAPTGCRKAPSVPPVPLAMLETSPQCSEAVGGRDTSMRSGTRQPDADGRTTSVWVRIVQEGPTRTRTARASPPGGRLSLIHI
eukprot:12719389-Alexandrium_andersonii.AAC.1